MSKIYRTAPLPFQGQKRFFLESFSQALIEMNKEKEIKMIVDLFGGSGLLSHTAKQILPTCRVIYNDFDNYHKRIKSIPATNILLEDNLVRGRGVEPPPATIHEAIYPACFPICQRTLFMFSVIFIHLHCTVNTIQT